MSDDQPKPFTTPRMAELQAEVEVTRAQLAATVDELSAQVDPRENLKRATEAGKDFVKSAVDADADPGKRRRSRIVLGSAAAAVALVVVGIARR